MYPLVYLSTQKYSAVTHHTGRCKTSSTFLSTSFEFGVQFCIAFTFEMTHLRCYQPFFFLQQQIHAQQLPHGAHGPGLPMGPHPGLPGMGPAAAGLLGFGAGLAAGVPGAPGGPHPAVAGAAHPLLKPADLHARDPQDMKRPGSTNAEERLVSVLPIIGMQYDITPTFLLKHPSQILKCVSTTFFCVPFALWKGARLVPSELNRKTPLPNRIPVPVCP